MKALGKPARARPQGWNATGGRRSAGPALEAQAFAHIERHEGCTWRDVAARYGWTHGTAVRAVSGLLDKGDVREAEGRLYVVQGEETDG